MTKKLRKTKEIFYWRYLTILSQNNVTWNYKCFPNMQGSRFILHSWWVYASRYPEWKASSGGPSNVLWLSDWQQSTVSGPGLTKLFSPESGTDPKEGQEDAACFPSRAPTKECTQIYRENSTEQNLMGQLTQDGLVNPIYTGPVKMRDYVRMWGVLVCRHQTCGNMATRIFKAK